LNLSRSGFYRWLKTDSIGRRNTNYLER
jgi:hypothetical protein